MPTGLKNKIERLHWGGRRTRRGSVLIIVIGLLVLMAIIGTAYVSTARVDRGAAATGSFNTQIDLLVQGVEDMSQTAIWQDVTTNFWTAATTPTNYTSPTQQTFLASRVPVMVNVTGLPANTPAWLYISAAPIANAVFESPYNPTGTSAAPAVLQYGQDRQNMAPTSIAIPGPSGTTTQYPALMDPKYPGQVFLAASAAGDGIADSALFRLPCGEINGVTYYAAIRIIDNNSAVNASTAWVNNNSPTGNDIYGDFFAANVNLQGLVADGQAGLNLLNQYRFNGNGTASLQPIDDNGNPRTDFTFISPYDALWMQLGRRLGNPGYNAGGVKYQALPMTECGTLAYHFCLPNPMSSPSVLENALPMALRPAGMQSTPYAPSQVAAWYAQMFNYNAESPGIPSTYLPRRALITARNGISMFTPNQFNNKGTYSPANSYNFGDMVQVAGTPFNYVCIQPIAANTANSAPSLSNANAYWAVEPWTDHVTKTPINTATFDQLWLAYWNVMQSSANAPTTASGSSTPAIFRNTIRGPQAIPTTPGASPPGTIVITPTGGDDTANIQNTINGSNPGSTIEFSPGQYTVSQTLNFLSNRTYLGAGAGSSPQLTPVEVGKLRSAEAAANALTLRGGGNDVASRLVYLGAPAGGAVTSTGTSTLSWTGGAGFFVTVGPNVTMNGLSFGGTDAGAIDITGSNISILYCTFDGLGDTQQGPAAMGIESTVTPNNITIDHCSVLNTRGDTGIEGWYGNNIHITYNTITNCWEGIHLFYGNINGFGTTDATGWVISHNDITQCSRHGIELQGQPEGMIVSYNYVGDWNDSVPGAWTNGHMAISAACGPTAANLPGNQIIDNVLVSNNSGGCAIECMGPNALISGNWAGPDWGTFALVGCLNTNMLIENNDVQATNMTGMEPVSNNSTPTVQNNQYFQPGQPGMPAQPSIATGASGGSGVGTITSATTLSGMVFGTARNPYMTRVYADNDSTLPNGGYIAVELYNPYNTPITLANWQLATLARLDGVVGVPVTPLISTQAWASNPPTIQPHGFITLASSATPPPQYTATPPTSAGSNLIVLSDLNSAFDNELVLLRPRRGNGTLSTSTDPNNPYNEQANVQDLVPVDSYDFTGLSFPSDPTGTVGGSNPAQEWYYTRPDDPNQNFAWHMVYPGAYNFSAVANANTPTPRLTATQVGPLASGLTAFGTPNSTSTYNDTPLQLANDQAPGPNPVGASGNLFPFGAFARNGDILHSPFIGAYRIQTNDPTPQLVELNPVTIDSTYAKIADPTIDAVTPGENIGRFAPIYPSNTTSTANDYSTNSNSWTPYHFSTQLFDYLTAESPVDWTPNANNATWQNNNLISFAPDSANLPNVDPNPSNQFLVPGYPGPAPQAVTTAKAPSLNPTSPTNDTVPLEGLININTAPWPVLATLPMVDDPVANANLAKAIVYYRDVDDGTTPGTPHPHGAFKTIWELNEVAVNTPSVNGGTPTNNAINGGSPVSFLQTVGPYNTNNYDPVHTAGGNEAGDLSPQGGSNNVYNDFESQNLGLTRISNLITTRSDVYTVYVIVQGWRNVGTASPSLVVQRRAAFLADRAGITNSNNQMTITNIPNQ